MTSIQLTLLFDGYLESKPEFREWICGRVLVMRELGEDMWIDLCKRRVKIVSCWDKT